MLGWDLDENDAYPVRISDPHLQQTPRFPLRRAENLNTGGLEALVFGREISDLNPDGEIVSGSPIPNTGDFQVTPAKKENQPRIVAVTELAVHGKTERVPVEPSAAISISWSQHDPATKDVHAPDHAARQVAPVWRPYVHSRTWPREPTLDQGRLQRLDRIEPARVLRTATSLPLDDLVSRGGFAEPFGAEFGRALERVEKLTV